MATNEKRKKLIKELDTIFSEVVRKDAIRRYKKCPFCKKKKIVCCFHFITRKKYSVRWDLNNAIGSCFGCNFGMEFNPHPFIVWYINEYRLENYLGLVKRSEEKSKITDLELEAMINSYKEDLKKYGV